MDARASTYTPSALTGCYSATVILVGKCPPRSRRGPIAWSPVSGPYQGRAGVLERHFAPLRDTLLTQGDHYMHLADLTAYLEADRELSCP